jgi:hypothetical protein
MIRKTVKGTFLEVTCAKLRSIENTGSDESSLSPIASGFIRLGEMLTPVTWQHEYGDHTAVVLEIEGKRDLHLTATVMVIHLPPIHLVRFCRLPHVVYQESSLVIVSSCNEPRWNF